ncbi:NUDIX domain-containing protein [Actinoplanes sp. NPDC026619]|uniref:NUDIX hydrolase n=1 Tax=Actinoplanes sp. NPDC026619 TaxID=3155798 RepID=UPI00340869DE
MTSEKNQRAQVDVHLILRNGDRVLLGQRINTGFGDGCWHMPSGHGEDGESALGTLVREAKEETGVVIDQADASLVHTMHHWTGSGRMALFFQVSRWEGDPVVTEPDKCAAWQWFPLDGLPEQMIDYGRLALEQYAAGEPYSERGWQE